MMTEFCVELLKPPRVVLQIWRAVCSRVDCEDIEGTILAKQWEATTGWNSSGEIGWWGNGWLHFLLTPLTLRSDLLRGGRRFLHCRFSYKTVRGFRWDSWLSCIEYISSIRRRFLAFRNGRRFWLPHCQPWEVSFFTYPKISSGPTSSSFLCSLNALRRWDEV